MDPCANLGCVLRVNASCEACTRKVQEVLSFICDSRNISIDVQSGVARIRQRVDINMVLRALAKSGQYAELVQIRVPHPNRRHVAFAHPLMPPRVGFAHHHHRHGIAPHHHGISRIFRHHHHHNHHHRCHCC